MLAGCAGGSGNAASSGATGGIANQNAPGGGAGGASYPTGIASAGGVTVTNLSYGTVILGAMGSTTLG